MAKITSVKTSADNNKLFTAQINDDNTREIKEYDITSGINNKSLNNTADVTGFDEGMDVITVNPTGDKFVGVDRRGRDVINLSTTNNFSVNTFNLLSSFKVDRLVRGGVRLVVKPGYDTSFLVNKTPLSFGYSISEIFQTTDNKILVVSSRMQINDVAPPAGGMVILKLNNDGTTDNSFTPITMSRFMQVRKNHITGQYFMFGGSTVVSDSLGSLPTSMFYIFDETGIVDRSVTPLLPTNSGTNSEFWPVMGNEVLDDGSILLTGRFDQVNGINYQGMVKLTPQGAIDQTFNNLQILNSNDNSESVQEIFPLSNNTILISGGYRSINNTNTLGWEYIDYDGNIIGKPNNLYGSIYDKVNSSYRLEDGTTILSGNFNNQTRKILKLDSNFNIDTSFPIITTGSRSVLSIIKFDGFLYFSGNFTELNQETGFNGLARMDFNGNIDITYKPYIASNTEIKNINDQLYMYGNFSRTVNGVYGNRLERITVGGVQHITTTEIPFETMGVTSDRLIKLNTTNTITTATNDFNTITISDGTNEVTILPSQINTQINANVLIGRNLTVTYDLTGSKDINTVLSEYNLTVNK